VVGEGVDAEQPALLVGRQQRGPGAGIVQRRGGQREVRRVGVVDDQQLVARVLHVVLDPFSPRSHHDRLAGGVVGVEQPDLAGQLAAEGDLDRLLVAGQVHADPEPLVRLGQHQDVLAGAQRVPPDLERPPGVVDPGVEDGGAVRGPGGAVVDVRELVRQELARGQVLHAQGEPLVTHQVDGVGEQPSVRGHVDGAEREELGVAGNDIAVEQHLLAGISPSVAGGSSPSARTRQVIAYCLPSTVRCSTSGCRAGWAHSGRSAGSARRSPRRLPPATVPGAPCAPRCRRSRPQVVEHLRAGLVPQPLVVVDEDIAVMGAVDRLAGGDGRLEVGHAGEITASARIRYGPYPVRLRSRTTR
jgi:hypothetical protein